MNLATCLLIIITCFILFKSTLLWQALDFSDSALDMTQKDAFLGLFVATLQTLGLATDSTKTKRTELDKIEKIRKESEVLSINVGKHILSPVVLDCQNGITCSSSDLSIKAADGRVIPAILTYPNSNKNAKQVVIHFHGGGGVQGSARYSQIAYALAYALNAAVLSIDYRLAPEHPYPAGVNDCFESIAWVFDNAKKLGFDPSLISVGGESAGSLFAAAAAQLWHQKNPSKQIHLLILLIPMLGPVLSRSYLDYENVHLLPMRQMGFFWDMYTTNVYDCVVDPICSPVSETPSRLTGLAKSVFVAPAKADVLYSEGLEYYNKLVQAGVNAKLFPLRGTHIGGMVFDMFLTDGRFRQAIAELTSNAK